MIKNNLTFKTEHGHNTRQISNIKVSNMYKKLTQSTYIWSKNLQYTAIRIKHSNSLKILKKKLHFGYFKNKI